MRLISLDCHYSGGGTKNYYICYACQNQIEYEKPSEFYTEKKDGDSIWRQVEQGQHDIRWGRFDAGRKK